MTETKKENEREIVLAILIEVLEKNQFSHIVIRQALDKYSYLSQKDRSFIARLSRGCVERKIELDAIIDKAASVKASKQKPVIRNILRMAAYQLKYMNVPEHAVCSEAVKLAAKKGFWSLKGFVNAVTRKMAALVPTLDWSDQPAVYYSVPQWLYDKLLSWYPKEKATAYLEAVVSQSGHPMYVHCHTGICSIEEIVSSLEKEGISVTKAPYADDCLELIDAGDIRRTKVFQDGLIQIQDISSALAAQCVAPQENSFCIDMCAAPGGKSIHLAKAKGGTTKVLSRDISWEKLELIEENRVRCHADNMQIEQWDACVPDEERKETADYVLADVPCSGLGILSRKPDIKYQLTQERLTELVSLQREILVNAAKLVKPGGVLVYSTCTINPEENEENVRYLLTQMPFELESLAPFIKEEIEGNDPSSGMLKLLPGQNQCDGFFVARLRRK